MSEQNKVNFGHIKVDAGAKSGLVRGVFDSVANNYDLMNDLMSFGLHRLWKRIAVRNLRLRPHHMVLDLASGTGDLSKLILKQLDSVCGGHLICSDINFNMLSLGRDNLLDTGKISGYDCILADGQFLPFATNSFDSVICGFGMRNITDMSLALAEIARVLKPMGRVVILEFSKIVLPALQQLYDIYGNEVVVRLGKYIAKDADSYRYLVDSIEQHPSQEQFANLIEQAGFMDVSFLNLTGGIVALHMGRV